MAFSRSSTISSSSDESSHTLTAVVSSSPTSFEAGKKLAFQTDGNTCPKDLRPVMDHIRKSVDRNTQRLGDVIRCTKDEEVQLDTGRVISLKVGDPKVFFAHLVAKASDEYDELDW